MIHPNLVWLRGPSEWASRLLGIIYELRTVPNTILHLEIRKGDLLPHPEWLGNIYAQHIQELVKIHQSPGFIEITFDGYDLDPRPVPLIQDAQRFCNGLLGRIMASQDDQGRPNGRLIQQSTTRGSWEGVILRSLREQDVTNPSPVGTRLRIFGAAEQVKDQPIISWAWDTKKKLWMCRPDRAMFAINAAIEGIPLTIPQWGTGKTAMIDMV